ncbi:CinA family protein [Chitinophaga sp. GCM10012297]|uniref:CinA family protein n=1 Tax=Chitinophaga chungangae TaxID=2821488 RepID=A0ABS3YI23_9BACT|nr:CinA family protein [Chitinophaga chungangae]MBO9153938.1 CinA family protein [Chitinophaga chungangae]
MANIQVIRDQLLRNKKTVAVAESVTAGLLQFSLAGAEDAAQFFQGGITVYNLGQKYRHLRVEPIHAAQCDCVDEQVAIEMAKNVCRLFSSHWGIAVTGYATPVPESDHKLFAWYAIAHGDELMLSQQLHASSATPAAVQEWYADMALTAFANVLSYGH